MAEGVQPPRGLGDLVRIYQGASSDDVRLPVLDALFRTILSWEASERRCNCLNGPYPAHESNCTAGQTRCAADWNNGQGYQTQCYLPVGHEGEHAYPARD